MYTHTYIHTVYCLPSYYYCSCIYIGVIVYFIVLHRVHSDSEMITYVALKYSI